MTITTVRTARKGIFPLDKALGLEAGSLSPQLAREVVWLSGLVTYGQVQQIMERLTKQSLPTTTVWEAVQRYGEELLSEQHRAQNQVSLERTAWENQRYDSQLRKGVSLDGGMVNVRGEGWKELKVGVVSSLLPPDQQSQDSPIAIQDDLHYTAVLGDVEAFAPALWALAVQHAVPYAGHVAVTADGAPWIWTLAADLFPCSTQIVDYYHASQHLAQAAQALFPDDTPSAQRWLQQAKDHLLKDEVWKIIQTLHEAALPNHAAYFEEHRFRMLYAMFRAQGFPIGSGTIESAVKQFKHRLAGPGMRWSRPGLQRMIRIRAAVLDPSLNHLWQAA